MKRFAIALIAVILLSITAFGQGVSINENGNPADGSAMLDVSSNAKGILIPRMPYLQRIGIADPATGLLVYQSNGAIGFYVYNGTAWEQIWAGAISIDDLSDGSINGGSVYLGSLAGYSDDGTNNYNVGVGTQALRQNDKGYFNVAIGYQALYNDTSSWNTAIGYQSFNLNTGGEKNTGLGFRAGYNNTTGRYNTLLGYNANNYNQTGSNNTIIGFQAGFGANGQSKSGNVFLGYQAGYSETGSNKLYIENSSTSSPLIYGEFDNDLLRVNGTLHIGTAFHFPTSDGSSGQVLATDGSGTVGWTTVTTGGGPTAINDLTDAKTGGNSVFLGAGAGAGDNATDNRNIALGISALHACTDGLYNAALGYWSSYHNTTGGYNISIGPFADYRNLGGSQNVLIGYQAGSSSMNHSKSGNIRIGYYAGYGDTTDSKLYIENSNSSTPLIWGDFAADSVRINGDLIVTGLLHGNIGIDDLNDGKAISSSVFLGESAGSADNGTDNKNVALGYHALASSTGENNIAIGQLAAENNVAGNYNIAIGSQANGNNTGGEKNVMIGYGAGYRTGSHTKTGNIFIGYAAGFNALTNNKLYIENSSSTAPLIWGDFENDSVRINGTLDINNAYSMPTSDGSSGQVLKTDGNGSLNWEEDSSPVYLNDLADVIAFEDYFIGYGGEDNTGYGNTALGHYSLLNNTSGARNTAIGQRASALNSSGSGNTVLGYWALYFNETGNSNTAIGNYALHGNLASYNTAVGDSSLYFNTMGVENTAIGASSLKHNGGDYNTAAGCWSLFSNISGNENSSFGYKALYENDDANYNTAMGNYALEENTSGDNNTAMGAGALNHNTDGIANSACGYETLIWNVNGDYNTAIGAYSGPGETFTNLNNTIALGYAIGVTSSNHVKIGNTGQTWIGGQVSWSTYSDERMKENIREDVKGLDFIMKLRPVTYHVNKDKIDNILGVEDKSDYPEKYDIEKIKQSGFLAQEVEQAAIESGYYFSGVTAPANENTPYSLSYAQFVVPLVKAIQEQQELIEELRAEIEELKKERVISQ